VSRGDYRSMRHWVGWPALDRLFSRRLPDWMAGWLGGGGGGFFEPGSLGRFKLLPSSTSASVLQFYSSPAQLSQLADFE